MREVELKSVVDDVAVARASVEAAGGVLEFEGSLFDLRYADASGELLNADQVLRLRVYASDDGRRGFVDWKGPTRYEQGYKIREELSSGVADPETFAAILERLGYRVVRDIERDISQYLLAGAVVRFETYPRMDVLVEVEGSPDSLERAIQATGLPRAGFTSDRLPDFVARFEARTGQRAALSRRELDGIYEYRAEDG